MCFLPSPWHHSPRLVESLLRRGADVSARSNDGESALHVVPGGYAELEAGEDPWGHHGRCDLLMYETQCGYGSTPTGEARIWMDLEVLHRCGDSSMHFLVVGYPENIYVGESSTLRACWAALVDVPVWIVKSVSWRQRGDGELWNPCIISTITHHQDLLVDPCCPQASPCFSMGSASLCPQGGIDCARSPAAIKLWQIHKLEV